MLIEKILTEIYKRLIQFFVGLYKFLFPDVPDGILVLYDSSYELYKIVSECPIMMKVIEALWTEDKNIQKS